MSYKRRAATLLVLVMAIVILASLDSTYHAMRALIAWAETIVAAHEVAGAVIFIAMSALSAMLAFVSTAVVVPIAIEAWGKLFTVLFLWIGWLSGGTLAYCIGRFLGRRVVRVFMPDEKLRPYETRLRGMITFGRVLLFQFALPSEIPGYVLGLLACPFHIYVMGLALAEFPFAVGAVYLGEGFLQRNAWMMIAFGAGGVLLTLLAALLFHRLYGELRSDRPAHSAVTSNP